MMIERRRTYARPLQRAVTIAMLSSLLLAAGTDWAAATTLEQLTGPGQAEIFVTVLFAAALCLLAVLMRQGSDQNKQRRRAPIRIPVSRRTSRRHSASPKR